MDNSARLTDPVSARDHTEGPADAPLTLVEYGDYPSSVPTREAFHTATTEQNHE